MITPRRRRPASFRARASRPAISSNWLAAERGIYVGGGIGEMSGKIFRVGHLGKATTREYLVEFLTAAADFLRAKGVKVPEGAGISALW